MASEKTDAIMIRIVEFSESSCIATMFTRDFGKIGAMAKANAQKPLESAIDLLTISRISSFTTTDSLDLLTRQSCSVFERRCSLPHLYAGYYIAGYWMP